MKVVQFFRICSIFQYVFEGSVQNVQKYSTFLKNDRFKGGAPACQSGRTDLGGHTGFGTCFSVIQRIDRNTLKFLDPHNRTCRSHVQFHHQLIAFQESKRRSENGKREGSSSVQILSLVYPIFIRYLSNATRELSKLGSKYIPTY